MSDHDHDGSTGFGVSHLKGMPVTLYYGVIVLAALAALFLLRHFFSSIHVSGDAGLR